MRGKVVPTGRYDKFASVIERAASEG